MEPLVIATPFICVLLCWAWDKYLSKTFTQRLDTQREFYNEIITSYEGLYDDQLKAIKELKEECHDKFLEGWVGADGSIQDYHTMYYTTKSTVIFNLEMEALNDTEMLENLQKQREALDDEIVDRIERVFKKMGSTLYTAIPESEIASGST